MRIWAVMDGCIRSGVVTSESTLPGRLKLRRRAPILYRRLMRGFYPGVMQGVALPAIGAGEGPAGMISSPDGFSSGQSHFQGEQTERGTDMDIAASRAVRVVGSFNHPVLPMPPVRNFVSSPQAII